MSTTQADAFITMKMDAMPGRTLVTGYLRRHAAPEDTLRSFSVLIDDANLIRRLPEWLAELRAEAKLGRLESLDEQQVRLAAGLEA